MHLFHIIACVVVLGGSLASANCPVGTFDTWSAWDRCSASCGGGIQKRHQSLCCPPDAHGQWLDCRATYNITEKFNFDEKPCNQICAHGTFIDGRCSCDPGYNDMCCLTRQPMDSTQTALGDLATISSTNTVTVTSRPNTNTAARVPSNDTTTETTSSRMSTTTETTSSRMSTTTETTSSRMSSITVTTPSSTSSTTVTKAPITNPIRVTTEPRTSTTTVKTTLNTSTTNIKTIPSTSTTTAASDATLETSRLRISTVNTNSIPTLTTPDHSSSHQAQNSSLADYADRKSRDDCTSTCSTLMVCKKLSRGGHHCECKKLGNTDLCVYALLIILGSVTVGMAALITTVVIVRKKRKIIPEKADVTEVGENVAVKN